MYYTHKTVTGDLDHRRFGPRLGGVKRCVRMRVLSRVVNCGVQGVGYITKCMCPTTLKNYII